MLQINNLTKAYGDNANALTNISTTIDEGKLIVVIGPSGAGKSTFLRCINRMIQPTSGEILFCGKDIMKMNKKELRKVRSAFGMIFQDYNLVEQLTVFENILHGRLGYKNIWQGIFGQYTEAEKKEALELMTMLGIDDKAYRLCSKLSGGQKQRVGIARALIQNPALILCDEPIASLDPKSAKKIMDYLKMIVDTLKITCIINLHQVDIARAYAHHIIGINSGHLVFDGPTATLTDEVISQIYGE